VLGIHLPVDRIQRFFPPEDAHRHAVADEDPLHLVLHPRNQILAPVARLAQRSGKYLVAPGVQEAKRQILQFPIGEIQPQPVGNRRINFQGFAADAFPFAARHVTHGAHVVGAVGQLDQDDPHVLGHGEQHLAKRLGLVLLPRVEFQLFQLGQPIDEFRHRGAKALHQLFFRDAAVFDGVVHECRHQGLGIELPLGALRRHRDRVGDVRVAVFALLAQVRLIGEAVGLPDAVDLGRAQVVKPGQQPGETGCSRAVRRVRLRGGCLAVDIGHGAHRCPDFSAPLSSLRKRLSSLFSEWVAGLWSGEKKHRHAVFFRWRAL